jgi:hypothetical protein
MRPDVRETLHRAAAPPAGPPDLADLWARGRRHTGHRRLAALAVPLAVLAIVVSTVALLRPAVGPPPRPPASIDLDRLPTGWLALPPPRVVSEFRAAEWTGQRLLVWADVGFPHSRPAGFAFDPRTATWTETALFPLVTRRSPTWQWTGREMLVWGGQSNSGARGFADGAAYDPSADRWRMLPPAPIAGRPALSVWTGREMVVWGDREFTESTRGRDGAAYDPARDTWRRITDAPVDLVEATAVWTGLEMVVLGVDRAAAPDAVRVVGAAYDPAADRWRRLPEPGLGRGLQAIAVWTGTEVVAVVHDGTAAAYDPARGAWRALPRLDGHGSCTERGAVVSGRAYVSRCVLTGDHDSVGVRRYDPAEDRWTDIAGAATSVSGGGLLIGAGRALLVLGRTLPSGDSVLLAYRPPD